MKRAANGDQACIWSVQACKAAGIEHHRGSVLIFQVTDTFSPAHSFLTPFFLSNAPLPETRPGSLQCVLRGPHFSLRVINHTESYLFLSHPKTWLRLSGKLALAGGRNKHNH